MFYPRNFLAVALIVSVAMIVSIDAVENNENLAQKFLATVNMIPQYLMERAGLTGEYPKKFIEKDETTDELIERAEELIETAKGILPLTLKKAGKTERALANAVTNVKETKNAIIDVMPHINNLEKLISQVHAGSIEKDPTPGELLQRAKELIESAKKILPSTVKNAGKSGDDLTESVAQMKVFVSKKKNIGIRVLIPTLETLINEVQMHARSIEAPSAHQINKRAKKLIESADKISPSTLGKTGKAGEDLSKAVAEVELCIRRNATLCAWAQLDNLEKLVNEVRKQASSIEKSETIEELFERAEVLIETANKILPSELKKARKSERDLAKPVTKVREFLAKNSITEIRAHIDNLRALINTVNTVVRSIDADKERGETIEELFRRAEELIETAEKISPSTVRKAGQSATDFTKTVNDIKGFIAKNSDTGVWVLIPSLETMINEIFMHARSIEKDETTDELIERAEELIETAKKISPSELKKAGQSGTDLAKAVDEMELFLLRNATLCAWAHINKLDKLVKEVLTCARARRLIKTAHKILPLTLKKAGKSERDLISAVTKLQIALEEKRYVRAGEHSNNLETLIKDVQKHAKSIDAGKEKEETTEEVFKRGGELIETAKKISPPELRKAGKFGTDLTQALGEMEELVTKKRKISVRLLTPSLETLINEVYMQSRSIYAGKATSEELFKIAEGLLMDVENISPSSFKKAEKSGEHLRKAADEMKVYLRLKAPLCVWAHIDDLEELFDKVKYGAGSSAGRKGKKKANRWARA